MEGDIFLHTNILWNYVLAVRPTKFKRPIFNKLHTLYATIWFSSGALYLLSHYTELYFLTDIEALTDNLRITLLISFSSCKTMSLKRPLAEKLIKYVRKAEQLILNGNDANIKEIFWKHQKLAKFTSKFFIYFGYLTLVLVFFIFPILYDYQHPLESLTEVVDNVTVYLPRTLPFSGSFPFDKYKYYKTVFAFHILSGTCACSMTIITDVHFWALMIFGVSQIKILQYRLANFYDLALTDSKEVQVKHKDVILMEYLERCIQEHREIITYVTDLNFLIRYLMLVDSVLTSVQIAVICFGCILSGFSLHQLFGLEFLSSMMIQLFCFYWYANEILLSSGSLTDAIWESKWYDCSTRVKKVLLFLMMRSRKPMVLYLGPLYQMSTETMLSILKTAGSYFAIMRQMYMDNDE